MSLHGQEHDGGGPGNRFGAPAQHLPVAVVDAAIVKGAIQQESNPFLHAAVSGETGMAQGEAGPGRWLDPGKVVFSPGPADQLQVDVVNLVGRFLAVIIAALPGQHAACETLGFRVGGTELRMKEEHQSRRPDRLLAVARQTVSAFGCPALPHCLEALIDHVLESIILSQSQQSQAARFQPN